MIVLENIYKKIRNEIVLKDINQSFEGGKIYGIYGCNGSGKTMLLKAISGLVSIDEGNVYICGEKLNEDRPFPKDTGIVIENMQLLQNYSPKDNLKILSKIKRNTGEEKIEETLMRVGLENAMDKKVKSFSLGMKQRLNIAQAIFENQKIILLDEPTNALDDVGRELIYRVLKEEKEKGAAIIIATHSKVELEHLCDVTFQMLCGRLIEGEYN